MKASLLTSIMLAASFVHPLPPSAHAEPTDTPRTRVGDPVARAGDEIVVCGQLFHTTTPVVLWLDPGGYDAYRVERRFSPAEQASWRATQRESSPPASPNRFGMRRDGLTEEEFNNVRGGGWPIDLLRERVDQFVIHYDVCGTSRTCFRVLHDLRGLSVHFLLDIDGTIYQTLDLKERAWHATVSNSRSIGVEIANIGAYAASNPRTLNRWYRPDADGRMRITLPESIGDGGVRTAGFVGYPLTPRQVTGVIQDRSLIQYDLTAEQYDALAKLTATLCRVFPKIENRYPRDAAGKLIPRKLKSEEWEAFSGILGHYHVQANKVDPGPAFQWELLRARVAGLLQ